MDAAARAAAPHPAPPLVLGTDTVVTRDVKYTADDEPRKLDVYASRNAKNAPVVLFVHGGGWTRGDKADVGSQPKLFNDNGIILVSLDYRLSPAHRHPAHVDDVASAIAWIRSTIARFGGDGSKLVVMGHSAGSHLAALVVTDPRPLAEHKLKLSDIRGTISLDGSAFDIVDRIEKGGEKLAENCRRAFGPDPADHMQASPLHHVRSGAGIAPFLLIYVKEDSLNHAQSRTFGEKLRDHGGKAELVYIDGKDHFRLAAELGTAGDAASERIVRFVQSATTP